MPSFSGEDDVAPPHPKVRLPILMPLILWIQAREDVNSFRTSRPA